MKKKILYSLLIIAILAVFVAIPVIAEGDPVRRTDFLTYTPSNNNVTMRYDILNDSAHYYEIVPPHNGSPFAYAYAGDSNILRMGEEYYVVYRVKGHPFGGQGWYWKCINSTDLVNWTTVWNVTVDDITKRSVNSIERSALRYYEGKYYFYFTWDFGGLGATWLNSVVVANSAQNISINLTDATKWINLTFCDSSTAWKFENVVYANGYYYFLEGGDYIQGASKYNLVRSPTPIGPFTNVSELSDLYLTKYSSPAPFQNIAYGTITYDPYSDYYILWATAHHKTIKYYWIYFVSEDMENWTVANRVNNSVGATDSYRFRYPELSIGSDIIAAEWDQNGDARPSIYLWNYPAEAAEAIFSYFPLIIGIIAVVTILGVGIVTRNPRIIVVTIILVGVLAIGAILIINAFQGEGFLW